MNNKLKAKFLLHKIKIKTVNPLVKYLFYKLDVIPSYTIFENTYGHEKSVSQKKSINNGEEIPWFTYPSLDYISQFDLSDKNIFEWGAGNSSIFFSKLCKTITSVEDNKEWYNFIVNTKRENQNIILYESQEEYIKSIHSFNKKFDIIIIDGKYRAECAKEAVKCLSSNGIIILDNSDWYKNTSKFLRGCNFIEVDFHGLGPINSYTSTTSLFLTRELDFKPLNDEQPRSSIFSIKNVED